MIIADIPNPSSNCGGLVSAQAGSRTISPPPLFTMDFGPELINAGQVSILTFTIDNRGSQLAATDVVLNHQLPDGLVLATPANPATTCLGGDLIAISGSNTISYTGGTVPAEEMCTVSVGVTGREGGNFPNPSGELTSSLGNSGSANETLDIQAVVSIALDVSASTETVIAGSGSENLTYVTTVTNSGPSAATGITITQAQTLPAGNAIATLGSFEQSTSEFERHSTYQKE